MADAHRPLSLVAVMAHPDDESRIIGGTLTKYAAEGVAVALYCATRGEAWREGADPDEQSRLRTAELTAACRHLGLTNVRLRDYPDGGLAHLDASLLLADIAASIREWAPQVVVSFGAEGRTLHPDHIAIHHAATSAFHLVRQQAVSPEIAPCRLFYTTVPASTATAYGWRFPPTPDDEIAVSLDVTPWLAQKRQATVVAHASQYHDKPFGNLDEETRWRVLAREDFVLAPGSLPMPPDERGDLFAGLR
ncbi:MAG: PIG-L deacetylase family protein [Thermomicrobiales bacterium]